MKLYIYKVESKLKKGEITPRVITLKGRATMEDYTYISLMKDIESLIVSLKSNSVKIDVIGECHDEKKSYIVGAVLANSRKDAWIILEGKYGYSRDYFEAQMCKMESVLSGSRKTPLDFIEAYGGEKMSKESEIIDDKLFVYGNHVANIRSHETLRVPRFEILTMSLEDFAKKQMILLAHLGKRECVRYIKKESISFSLNEDNSFCEVTSGVSEDLFEHVLYIRGRCSNAMPFSPKQLERGFNLKGYKVKLKKFENNWRLYFYTEVV